MKILTVVNVEVRQDKNDNDYKLQSFKSEDKAIVKDGLGRNMEVFVPSQTRRMTAFPERQWEGSIIPASETWDLSEGDKVVGDIITREVHPYQITDQSTGEVKTLTRFTKPVIGNTDDVDSFEAAIAKSFNQSGIYLLNQELPSEAPVRETVATPSNASASVSQEEVTF